MSPQSLLRLLSFIFLKLKGNRSVIGASSFYDDVFRVKISVIEPGIIAIYIEVANDHVSGSRKCKMKISYG
jgi:hypothetical protein